MNTLTRHSKWAKSALFMSVGLAVLGTSFPAQAAVSAPLSEKVSGSFRQMEVKGVVRDEQGLPLPGASVLIKGSTTGTQTNADGAFSIEVPNAQTVLVVSYTGYGRKEVTVGNQTTIDVVLASDDQALDEVVVVGYGTQRKVDITGSVAAVKSESLMERPALNVNQAISGRMPGVSASDNSGRPGGRSRVRIRGFSSINATNDPLYVVDGIIFTEDISVINPNDIESVDVLKDASSTAIYGTRGANGVIMITTKKGRRGTSQINYDAFLSVNTLARKQGVLNSRQWMEIEELGYANAAKYDPTGFANGNYANPLEKRQRYAVGNSFGNAELFTADGQPLYDTDWQDLLTRDAIGQSHNLSLTGANEKSNYGLYLSYFDDQGVIINSYNKRYSARAAIDHKVRDWLTVGGTMGYSRNEERRADDGTGGNNIPRMMIEMVPFIPYQYPDGTYGRREDYDGLETGDNPRAQSNEVIPLYNKNVFNGNSYARISLLEGLDFTSTIGVNVRDENRPYSSSSFSNFDGLGRTYARINSFTTTFWQWSNHINYNRTFGDHTIGATLGTEAQRFQLLRWQVAVNDMSDNYYQWYNLQTGSTLIPPESEYQGYQMQSYFARANYGYKDKYLVTATGRFDGSSRFGINNRVAFFPSIALGWRIDQEEFMQGSEAISNLKLRASYGLTGNSEIGNFRSNANLAPGNYVFDGRLAPGTILSTLPNPDLRWEKTAQANIGVDLGLWDNRVTIELDAYQKDTRDLLLETPVPTTSGYSLLMTNVGSMRNRGVELGLNTRNIDNEDFTWTTSFNFSYLKNEITGLTANNQDVFRAPNFLGTSSNILRVGESVGSLWGLVREGTWGTDEAEQAARYNRLPGDVKYRDANDDGQINEADRTIIGKAIPDFYGGFFNTFRYKNWDLMVELQYSYGNDVMRLSNHSAEDRTGIANSYSTVLNAWTEENQNTPIAQIRAAGVRYDSQLDSHMVEDGSFIRGRNLMLGYNFSPEILDKIKLSRLRLYASVQNFFLITNYNGYDPEVTTFDDAFAQGVTFHDYPRPRTFTFGVNATF